MGSAFYVSVKQFSDAGYLGATNEEDDLAMLVGNNGFGYRADDHGDTASTATDAGLTGTGEEAINLAGVIEENTDLDVFELTVDEGYLNLTVSAVEFGDSLDVGIELRDAGGNLVAMSEDAFRVDASISAYVAAGTYFLSVEGVGLAKTVPDKYRGSDSDRVQGYSDYGSLGQYEVVGTAGAAAPVIDPATLDDGNMAGAGALSLGQTVSGDLDSIDIDTYRFEVTETTTIGLDFDDTDDPDFARMRESIYVYDAAGVLFDDRTDFAGGESTFYRMEMGPGVYYAAVGNSSATRSLNPVTGEVRFEPGNDGERGTYTLTMTDEGRPFEIAFDAPTTSFTEGSRPIQLVNGTTTTVDTDIEDNTLNGGQILARTINGRQFGERYTLAETDDVDIDTFNFGSGRAIVVTVGPANNRDRFAAGYLVEEGNLLRIQLREFSSELIRGEVIDVLLDAMRYESVNDAPAESKTAEIWVETAWGSRQTQEIALDVTAVNNPPLLGQIRMRSTDFESLGEPVKVSGKATIADGDLDGGTLRVVWEGLQPGDEPTLDLSGPLGSNGNPSGELADGDQISLGGVALATVAVATSSGAMGDRVEWTFTLGPGTDRFAAREIFRAAQFAAPGDAPVRGTRMATFEVIDDQGASDSATIDLVVRDDEDPAVLTLGTTTGRHIPFSPPTRLDADASLLDPDSDDFADGCVVLGITEGRQSRDRLRLLDESGAIILTGNDIVVGGAVVGTVEQHGIQLRLRFSSTATLGDVEAVLSRVAFDSLADVSTGPQTGLRTITFNAIDRGNNLSGADYRINVNNIGFGPTIASEASFLDATIGELAELV